VAAGSLIPTVLDVFMAVSASAYDDNPLRPIGGVVSILASLLAGVAIVRARRLLGWSRWVVLGFAIYVLGFLFVPLFFGAAVDAIRETIWGLWWVAIGAALVLVARPASR
jgi:peptidoglycan/LPS O-acetylase OafA/YrhL